MYSSNVNFVARSNGMKHDQRGFFDAGIGLALLALFSVATSAIVANETERTEQQLASCAVGTTSGDRSGASCDDLR